MLESQESVLECANTCRILVLECSANTPLLDWYPGPGVVNFSVNHRSSDFSEVHGHLGLRKLPEVSRRTAPKVPIPSLLTWDYNGIQKEEHGRQRAHAGDAVNCDQDGLGTIDRLDGSSAWVEFGEGEAKELKKVSLSALVVVVVNNREASHRCRPGTTL